MTIRAATIEDATAISRLIQPLAAKFVAIDFDEDGARHLLVAMEPAAIEDYFITGMRYHVAEEYGVIVGVVGVRDHTHLYHLFVAEARQRQGLATALWREARAACLAAGNPGDFTVNASRSALPFYKKLGFVEMGPPELRRGVIATPMKLSVRVIRARATPLMPTAEYAAVTWPSWLGPRTICPNRRS